MKMISLFEAGTYDVAVIGAGHAGCEAALALARMGFSVLLTTLNLDGIALLACNPSIGGTSKGHLVREVDALGGEMALAADDTLIQMRMLNTSKGPAVHSSRAQMDKFAYHFRMKHALEKQPNLRLLQAEIVEIEVKNGRVTAVHSAAGERYAVRATIVCTGVYLEGKVIVGQRAFESGPNGLRHAHGLSACLSRLDFNLMRFKTGTPARIDARSVDISKMQIQHGDRPIIPFSFMTREIQREQTPCYLTYTTGQTHQVIRDNIHRSPLYTGLVQGRGPRYCPSIEDKVMRFADKDRHPVFLEPEGRNTQEWYVQGVSTSLSEDVQIQILRSIIGLERVRIMRYAYAIDYDCIDARALWPTLHSKSIHGLFFAGQINGTSGYEEAAGQGLLCGINAAQYLRGEPEIVLGRADAYIGVLVDDLVTKGTVEPYRMMTSRAEYRLLLRQDNADLRLTEIGRKAGLVTDERYRAFMEKKQAIEKELQRLEQTRVKIPDAATGQSVSRTLMDCMRAGMTYGDTGAWDAEAPELPADVREQVAIQIKYEGYIQKQNSQVNALTRMENQKIPPAFDYLTVSGLSNEARQKLLDVRPLSMAQAMRISGVTPSDIAILSIALKREKTS